MSVLFLGALRRVISSKGMNVLFIICGVFAQAGRVEPLLEACVVKICPEGTSGVFIPRKLKRRLLWLQGRLCWDSLSLGDVYNLMYIPSHLLFILIPVPLTYYF